MPERSSVVDIRRIHSARTACGKRGAKRRRTNDCWAVSRGMPKDVATKRAGAETAARKYSRPHVRPCTSRSAAHATPCSHRATPRAPCYETHLTRRPMRTIRGCDASSSVRCIGHLAASAKPVRPTCHLAAAQTSCGATSAPKRLPLSIANFYLTPPGGGGVLSSQGASVCLRPLCHLFVHSQGLEALWLMKTFDVGGMTCAACQAHVEKAVCGLPGVQNVAVNLLSGAMAVDLTNNSSPKTTS